MTPPPVAQIPACFQEGEPYSPLPNERTEVYQVPRPAVGATPAAGRVPNVAAIVHAAGFPLYGLQTAPGFTPVQLRESFVPAGTGSRVTLFGVQYRVTVSRGSGTAIVLSAPSTGSAPTRDDLDDGLDAVRILARLPGQPTPGPLQTDPTAALHRIGCPVHESVMVPINGNNAKADFVSWPGAPQVHVLRLESGDGTEVTVESALLSRDTLLSLPNRVAALQRSPGTVRALQAAFEGRPAQAQRAPTPASRRGAVTPVPTH